MLFAGKLQKLLKLWYASGGNKRPNRRTFRLCTYLGELTSAYLKLTTGRKSLIKQQILMYTTAVYTLV